jgi:hypothetical protein
MVSKKRLEVLLSAECNRPVSKKVHRLFGFPGMNDFEGLINHFEASEAVSIH